MSDELINKYRPQSFDDVIGHEAVIKALRAAVAGKTARTFMFTGPAGVGKTTLARIVAAEAGCLPDDRHEIDAATNTGIEDMRNVTAGLDYQPLGEGTIKAVIVDEVHALSKAALQSLLKSLEEPQPWVYWMLCTTEPGKILQTIKTRAMHCDLKPVPSNVLMDHLDMIANKEKMLKGDLRDQVVELCVAEAHGSVRQAISNLVLCSSVSSIDEAEGLVAASTGSAEAFDLARALLKRAPWKEVQDILRKLKESNPNPESVRHVVRAYMTTVIIGAKSESAAGGAMEVLDAFSTPFYSSDGLSPVVLACGKVLLS